MERPIEPKLADFGLTEEEMRRLSSLNKISIYLAVAFIICLASYWIYGTYEKDRSSIGLIAFISVFF